MHNISVVLWHLVFDARAAEQIHCLELDVLFELQDIFSDWGEN